MNKYSINLDGKVISVNLSRKKSVCIARATAKKIKPYRTISVEVWNSDGDLIENVFTTNGEKR